MVKKLILFRVFTTRSRFYNIIYKRIFGFFKGNKELIQARLNDSINYITEIPRYRFGFYKCMDG